MEPSGLLLFFILFALILCVLGLFALVSRISAWGRGEPFLPYARFQRVNRSLSTTPNTTPHSESAVGPLEQTNQTDGQTDEVSARASLWREFVLDKTRARLIAVMVDSGLTVSEIRALLKGDSGAIGTEVEAARQRLGKAPSPPYRTPIAGRPTDPRYYPDEPELEFQPPR